MLGNSNTIANRNSAAKAENGLIAILRKLNSIQVGPRTAGNPTKIKARPFAELLRLLLMLLENGLSLPKAFQSLAEDRSTRKFSHVSNRLSMTIEAGGTLSQGMQHYPKTFTQMQVQQIRIGEQSGATERPLVARSMDTFFLKLPIVRPWLRDVAVLQFSEGILLMVECGYRPVEAVDMAADCVRNREVRAAVDSVQPLMMCAAVFNEVRN